MTEVRVPQLGESVTEATIAQWFKAEGETVAQDEPLVELETDKVTLEVSAPASGILSKIVAKNGDIVEVGALLGSIGDGNGAAEAPPVVNKAETTSAAPITAPSAGEPSLPPPLPPSVRRIVAENKLDVSAIEGTGKGGRITKADALSALQTGGLTPLTPLPVAKAPVAKAPLAEAPIAKVSDGPRPEKAREERVTMTRLRQTIARRLKEAQNSAAMLTTFNEVDMSQIMAIRTEFKATFEKKHGVRLGFMSFFVKACITALRDIPVVNAEIEGSDLIYKNHYDIGIAIGAPKGLIVPVLRDADAMSLADIEKAINDFAQRARDGTLKLDELQGGTFTISNGGIYGSMLSTPILNAPQSGILGMHKIEKRAMVVDDEIVIRPIMYLALTYDHRVVDGKEAVTFLVRVKQGIEAPERLILDL